MKPFTEIWFLIFELVDSTQMSSFFFPNFSNSSSPINRLPIPFCYPTFDKPGHQPNVDYMPSPINIPIQGFNLLPCIWRKEWIGGFKFFDITKDGGNV